MAALTANKVDFSESRAELGITQNYTVKAANTIFQGAILSLDAGEVAVASSTIVCAGIATQAAAAGEQCPVRFDHIVELPLSGAAAANVGALLYATTDNDFTLTPNTCIVGRIVALSDEADKFLVHLRLF